jgi:hypothetical protein
VALDETSKLNRSTDHMIKSARSILGAVLAIALPAAAGAQQLTTTGVPVSFSGTGLGTVATVLTLNSQANNTMEMGCVGRNASGDFFGNTGSGVCVAGSPTPDVQTGASQTQTQLLSALGISSSSQFGLLLNATEPAGNGITVQSLTATFFNSMGMVVGSVSLGTPFTTLNTATGIGNTGFLFTITGAANANLFAAGNRVGLSATLGCSAATQSDTCQFAQAGNDTFFLVNAGGSTAVIPEPSTYALLGAGLAGLAGVARRRRISG